MSGASSLLIDPRLHDLGDGFVVRRLLPFRLRRHVGPFVFFDHFGPVDLAAGRGMDVRPHPHVGLATVTYLYEGAIEHRDSLASDQVIRPGDVNWMTAGRGIVHSERTPAPERSAGHRLHGVQTWLALPLDSEDAEPDFHHHDATRVEAGIDFAQLQKTAQNETRANEKHDRDRDLGRRLGQPRPAASRRRDGHARRTPVQHRLVGCPGERADHCPAGDRNNSGDCGNRDRDLG